MKKLIAWSVCLALGGGLLAENGDNAADKKTAAVAQGHFQFDARPEQLGPGLVVGIKALADPRAGGRMMELDPPLSMTLEF